jgi:hypothetical protein
MKKSIRPTEVYATRIRTTQTSTYQAPDVERIKLDNDISLILQSDSPTPPGGSPFGNADDTNVNDPFKTSIG